MGFKLAEPRRPAGLGEGVTPCGALGTDWRGLSQEDLHEVAGCTAAAAGKVVGSSGRCSWGKAGPVVACLGHHAILQKQQLAAIGSILRGHEESPARLSVLIVLELVSRGLLRKSDTVLKNIPDWDGALPTPQQLITMAGGLNASP